MELSYLHIIIISALIELVFLSIIVSIRKKGNKVSNRLFSSILVTLSIIVFNTLLFSLDYFNKYNNFIIILNQFLLLLGPLIYFYILSIFKPEYKFGLKTLLHLLIFVIFLIPSIVITEYFIPQVARFRIASASTSFALITVYYYLIFLILKRIKSDNKKKKYKSSNQQNSNFWLLVFLAGCYLILFVKILLIIYLNLTYLFILDFYDYHHIWYPARYIYYIVAFFFFYTVIYIVINKSENLFPKQKYKKSVIATKDKEKYLVLLSKLLKDDKRYLDPELNLDLLAKELLISRTKLSQIINEECKSNFNDFINSFRIEYCKKLFKDPINNKKSIIEILFESGFNSKPTFNNTFKKHTGMTPKQFRKLITS